MEQQTNNSTLLVMDMQDGIVAMLPNAATILANTAKAIAIARDKNIPVIFVVAGFRQGCPEISSKNKSFASVKERFGNADMAAFMKVHNDLQPKEGEVIVTKRRFSAFTGSDLEVLLRAYDTQHLILTGIATSGVVLSTLREAADKDYQLTVLSDCCTDSDEEVHQVLLTKVFPRQAEVLTVNEWNNL